MRIFEKRKNVHAVECTIGCCVVEVEVVEALVRMWWWSREGRASVRVFGSGPEAVSRFGRCRVTVRVKGKEPPEPIYQADEKRCQH